MGRPTSAPTYRDPFAPAAEVEHENAWAAQRECRWGMSMSRLFAGVHSGLVGQALDPTQIHASMERYAAAECRPRVPLRRPSPPRRTPQAMDSPARRTRPPTGLPRARPAEVGPSGYLEPYRRVAPPPRPQRDAASFMLPTAAFHSYVSLTPSSMRGWGEPVVRSQATHARPGGRIRPGSAASATDLVGTTLVFRSADTGGELFRSTGPPDRRARERDSSALYAERAPPAGSLAKGSWATDRRAPSYERAGSATLYGPPVAPPSPAHAMATRPSGSAAPRRF